MRLTVVLVLLLVSDAGPAPAGDRPRTQPAGVEFFERQVRPVLIEQCISCHGPQKQKGGLRLDTRENLLKGGESGPVVVPGDPGGSLLIQAVRQTGDLKMPPKAKLPSQAVSDLAAWVKMGAPWPAERPKPVGGGAVRHWAFQAVRDRPTPAVANKGWARTSIDPFILARLEAKGLTPSPEADRRTLIRRATFDLLGLPPTPEEVATFERDARLDAYERLIDRLLASPHYGERWGRYWLDVARYADTKGYVFFEEADFPWAYTYRDYVIRSFNEDLPYDRFILEQLAADRLPLGADKRPLTALGFLTLGGRFMNNGHDIIDDRIDVVCRGLMGLTVGCARCHDHKYDPIPARDYYALYGVFASCAEPTVPPLFTAPPATPEYQAFAKELQARERKLTEFVQDKHAELVKASMTRAAEYLLAAQAAHGRPSMEEFMLIADGNDLNPRMVVRWQVYLERTRKRHHPLFAPWHALTVLPEKDFAGQAPAVLSKLGPLNPLVARALGEHPPHSLAELAQRYGELLNAAERKWQETGRPFALPDPAWEELRQVFHGPDGPPNVAMNPLGDLDLLPDRPSQARLQELRKAVETWRATGPGAPPRAMVLEDRPTPFEPYVFVRGNANNRGESVPRRFLTVLAGDRPAPFHDGSGRLELARAIANKDNPLTARVLVNRVWMHHFGTPLVRTPGDFGLRSEPPTHPELLDHLAARFMNDGWSLKALHRRIMLSAAYRQRSDDRPTCHPVDPENSLLWRMNRRRLDFEATRDSLLAAAGTLDQRVGGSSVKDITAPAAHRRTLYGYLDRLNVPSLYRTFDFPSPDATSPERARTTVPQQALFLMNSPFVLEQAKRLLLHSDVQEKKETDRRITRVYQLLYGRAPAPDELSLARDYLTGAGGDAAAWANLVQALFLGNEFDYID